jgi:hypothetical protein
MVTAEAFVQEMETRNQHSFKSLLSTYVDLLGKEDLAPTDVLRLEQKSTIEAIEVAALWLADTDSLEVKMDLGAQCGDGSRQYRLLCQRLDALGVDLASLDPRYGGYSKLFAFFRSLQSTEERCAAGALTVRALSVLRLTVAADHCEAKGDPDSAHLLREPLQADHQRHIEIGRRTLVATTATEESQARARRAAFRTIELLGEVWEPGAVRKFLTRSLAKKPVI